MPSDAIRQEQVRTLRAKGLSEAQALVQVYRDEDESAESPDKDPSDDDEEVKGSGADESTHLFVVVTKDGTGLGWAKKLLEEGESVVVATTFTDPDETKEKGLLAMKRQLGQGWVEVVEMTQAMQDYQGPDTIWVFAENSFVDEAKQLLNTGQAIFPPSIELSDKMEHDRDYAVSIAEEYGLMSPATHEFSSREEGIAFLEAHPDQAFVFKPDDNGGTNFSTLVPIRKNDADANAEVLNYLKFRKEDTGTFILQERIDQEEALEVNVEAWFYEGVPFLATVGLEIKRKDTYDLGEMAGCAGDFTWFIPLDSPLVNQTIGLLFPFYEEQAYTGFADVNVIFTKDGTPHFLEVCNRFGYNAHVSMFLGLATRGFGAILADYVSGNVEAVANSFSQEKAGSLTIFLDHPRAGLPVHLDDEARDRFYPFDGMCEDEQLLLTGYSDEIGIFVARGTDLAAIADDIYEQVVHEEVVSVPDQYFRMDLGRADYSNSPLLRFKALEERKLI